ncbi:MAG: PQQ-binding-like beta-propeller repeat protein [Vicinamibacterales bacterium]
MKRCAAGALALPCLLAVSGQAVYPTQGEWRQWGGPGRDFHVEAGPLAETWPDAGPPRLWERPLGLGHSAIVVDDGRLFTLYRPGKQVSRKGPWEAREIVVALDAATGKTLWEHEYPSEPLNFSFGAGPHATPLVVGDLVFTAGSNKQIHALEKRTGTVVWMRDLVKDFGAPPTLIRPAVKAGYGCSPLAYKNTIICQAGGPGQAVIALRQKDGSVAWRSGDFLTAEAAPILIDVDGQTQLVVLGGQRVNGLDPDTGKVFWSHPHDTSGDMNNSTPIWGSGNILFITSAYDQGSRAIRLSRKGDATTVEELWFTNRFRLMFTNGIRIGGHLYGTSGDFGPAFLGAIDINTGKVVWQERGFSRANLVHADGKLVILDEDGQLALARVSPEGMKRLATTQVFTTTAWTVPTLVGTTLYARDREKMVAISLGPLQP